MPYLKVIKVTHSLWVRHNEGIFLSTCKTRSVTIFQPNWLGFALISSHFEDHSGGGSSSLPAACEHTDEVVIIPPGLRQYCRSKLRMKIENSSLYVYKVK